MKLQRIVFALIGLVLLSGGALLAQQVKTDYDRGAIFGNYKTYSWEQVKTRNALLIDRIKNVRAGGKEQQFRRFEEQQAALLL